MSEGLFFSVFVSSANLKEKTPLLSGKSRRKIPAKFFLVFLFLFVLLAQYFLMLGCDKVQHDHCLPGSDRNFSKIITISMPTSLQI